LYTRNHTAAAAPGRRVERMTDERQRILRLTEQVRCAG
jgi:hypothetical protein